jgi:NADH/NAD ratio-sensing transcriptional regulator Rex
MSLEAAVQQLAAQQEKMYNLLVELSNHIPKKEMTAHEVSEFLGLHPVTISRKKHLLGHNGKKGGAVRYDRAAVVAYMNSNREKEVFDF